MEKDEPHSLETPCRAILVRGGCTLFSLGVIPLTPVVRFSFGPEEASHNPRTTRESRSPSNDHTTHPTFLVVDYPGAVRSPGGFPDRPCTAQINIDPPTGTITNTGGGGTIPTSSTGTWTATTPAVAVIEHSPTFLAH